MIRYNTKEDKLEMSYEDICMTLHDCSDTLDCSTGYGGTYEAIVDYIDKLQNNWNELKKGIEDVLKTTYEKWGRNCANEFDLGCLEIEMTMNIYGEILSKMQELEGNNEL